MTIVSFLKRLGRNNAGATAVEYGLILAMIFLAMIGAIQVFSNETIKMWNDVASKMENASKK
jgi:pilus assembly protein Flp/PilA